jgi:hypothetical protein
LEEIDIWCSAHLFNKRYGDEAALFAAMRADALLEEGDPEGCRAWQRIQLAIISLQQKEPYPGESQH